MASASTSSLTRLDVCNKISGRWSGSILGANIGQFLTIFPEKSIFELSQNGYTVRSLPNSLKFRVTDANNQCRNAFDEDTRTYFNLKYHPTNGTISLRVSTEGNNNEPTITFDETQRLTTTYLTRPASLHSISYCRKPLPDGRQMVNIVIHYRPIMFNIPMTHEMPIDHFHALCRVPEWSELGT